jgi:hypothetical protein
LVAWQSGGFFVSLALRHGGSIMAATPSFADLRVLEICRAFSQRISCERFAGAWIKGECDRQGVPFHQSQLSKLVRAGHLEKDYSSRGGSRRYYRFVARPVLLLT